MNAEHARPGINLLKDEEDQLLKDKLAVFSLGQTATLPAPLQARLARCQL